MDKLQSYYGPVSVQRGVPAPPPPSFQVAASHLMNPAANHAGIYPMREDVKRVIWEVEEYPPLLFQTPPTYRYHPEHSNVDVYLAD